jgi:hypothetical protein
MPDTATYIYCIVERSTRPRLVKVPKGLPGSCAPSLTEVGRNLWAVTAGVPLALYGAAPLEERLHDINWVADIAVAHEAVVQHFAAITDAAVVPMKLFTMFSSETRASEEMNSRRQEIDAVFARIAGCEEWGVRVTRRAMPARTPSARPRTGTAFLAARKKVRDDARTAVEKAATAAGAAYDLLLPLARDARRRRDSPSGVTPPLLEAAFLVKARGRQKFRVAARRAARVCEQAGAEMTLTGPWPPYNFVGEGARGETS